MTDALARLRADVTRDDVLRAIQEYDRLGPEQFFSEHGFGPSRSYELVWDERRYPHKAILGTAYEFATGQHLGSADFKGGEERRRRGAQETTRSPIRRIPATCLSHLQRPPVDGTRPGINDRQ